MLPLLLICYTLKPGVLDDSKLEDRMMGIKAGLAWISCSDITVVYSDLGISPGMKMGMDEAKKAKRTIEIRTLGKDWESKI